MCLESCNGVLRGVETLTTTVHFRVEKYEGTVEKLGIRGGEDERAIDQEQ